MLLERISLTLSCLYRPSLPADFLDYILCLYRTVANKFL